MKHSLVIASEFVLAAVAFWLAGDGVKDRRPNWTIVVLAASGLVNLGMAIYDLVRL